MDTKQYIHAYGDTQAEVVAIKAGTTLVYFKQLASGFRKPSPTLAKELEQASGGILKKYCLRPDIFDAPQAA